MRTPSSANNQFGISCSFPGLCTYCFTEVCNFEGSVEVMVKGPHNDLIGTGMFRPKIKSFKANLRQSEFVISDGTRRVIVLCEECDDDIEPRHMAELMESEINGAQKEVDELIYDWTPSLKKEYMKGQSELFIKDRINRKWDAKQLALLTKPDKKKLKIKMEGK